MAIRRIVLSEKEKNTLRQIAKAQRNLIWSLLFGAICTLFGPVYLLIIPFILYSLWRLAKALGFSTTASVFWAIAAFIPLVSLICMLILNSKATDRLQTRGISVGFMGVRPSDMP